MLFQVDDFYDYDVSSDGKRFVVAKSAIGAHPTQLSVITGGADEIARRIEAGSR